MGTAILEKCPVANLLTHYHFTFLYQGSIQNARKGTGKMFEELNDFINFFKKCSFSLAQLSGRATFWILFCFWKPSEKQTQIHTENKVREHQKCILFLFGAIGVRRFLLFCNSSEDRTLTGLCFLDSGNLEGERVRTDSLVVCIKSFLEGLREKWSDVKFNLKKMKWREFKWWMLIQMEILVFSSWMICLLKLQHVGNTFY